ncbi:MAG: hypothetical protein HC904_08425 [Blastochloris sp.]|nr:hypothetical protein [Blastochloris sp.]
MSTVEEIEAAIQNLAPKEREELENRLFGPAGIDSLSTQEHTELLAAIDEADAETGEGLSLEQMQSEVRSWFGK